MSWLLFLDESGHDHRDLPYEVRGGFAIHASRLWPFIQAVRNLEQTKFGTHLTEHRSELKGSKLLHKYRFKWEKQGARMDDQARRKHALNFLNSSAQGRQPRRDEFTAYGQACIQTAEGVALLLKSHGARIFAAMIPPIRKPKDVPADLPRKDLVFLLERYYYFLEEVDDTGLLVMDGTDKHADRAFVRQMEKYFTETRTGQSRAQRVVPAPLFVESDMAYGIQVADLCVYVINWGHRFGLATAPVREEIRDFARLLEPCIWSTTRERQGESFRTRSVVFVPDPYEARQPRKGRDNSPQK